MTYSIKVEVSKGAFGDEGSTEKYNFDMWVGDKFPYQPPRVFCRTNFLADGGDLLDSLLLLTNTESWKPEMTLQSLVKTLPSWILTQLKAPLKDCRKYHLGKEYDLVVFQH